MASVPTPLPYERSYWIIPGRLLAGEYPSDVSPETAQLKLHALLECGIQRVINLMEVDEFDSSGESLPPYEQELRDLAEMRGLNLSCQRFPIKDQEIPTRQQMRFILDAIDQSLANGEVLYIHCLTGRGRTGTVIGCFLARHNLAAGRNVLEKITSLRSQLPDCEQLSPETESQQRLVTEWREGE
jgi:hypothetical protein